MGLSDLEWHLADSSNVGAFAWQDDTLFVRFLSGALYTYDDVSEEVFKAMLAAPSKGKFLNRYIKPRTGFLKVLD